MGALASFRRSLVNGISVCARTRVARNISRILALFSRVVNSSRPQARALRYALLRVAQRSRSRSLSRGAQRRARSLMAHRAARFVYRRKTLQRKRLMFIG